MVKTGLVEAIDSLVPLDEHLATFREMKRMQNVPFASAVGSIMYAMRCTRPDVAFTQNITSRFQQNSGEAHWTAVKNILNGAIGMEKLQINVLLHSMPQEADSIAASEAINEAVWIRSCEINERAIDRSGFSPDSIYVQSFESSVDNVVLCMSAVPKSSPEQFQIRRASLAPYIRCDCYYGLQSYGYLDKSRHSYFAVNDDSYSTQSVAS
ncbi:hypothetical protein Tco_0154624 [Tanacetum coccineum]